MRIMDVLFRCVAFHMLLLPLLIVSPQGTSEEKPPMIFNFGDSNSDTGGLSAAYGLEMGYPYGRQFFHNASGRASDGRLIIDFFCEHLNTGYLTRYLNSLQPNFANGVNFAVAGAATYPKHALFSLDIQVLQFKLFRNRSIHLQSKRAEDFENALYTIDIGQNDLTYNFEFLPYAEAIGKIPSYITEIKNAISDIYQLGGRKFWVHNTGPFGCLPRQLTVHKVHTDNFDEHGCIKSDNEGAKLFNTRLKFLCVELRHQLVNSTVVYVDVYSIKYDLIANSMSHGFKDPLMSCCGDGGPPYNYNPGNDCLGFKAKACEEGTPYISWDGTHYTEAANAIVASKILSTQYSTPPYELKKLVL